MRNPSIAGKKPGRVFLSYGHDEHVGFAARLKRDLESAGHPVWFDSDSIRPGSDWERYIEEGLTWLAEGGKDSCFILLMTPHSVRRPDGFCLNELARAVASNVRIVPVMLTPCEPPLSICRIQWLDMQDCLPLEKRGSLYRQKLGMLLDAIEYDHLDVEGFQSLLRGTLRPLSFDADVRHNLDRFVGRAWVVDRIDRWLADGDGERIFWITGMPGIGKTALSAWLCANRPDVVAFHFCRHDNVQKIDPRRCIMSLAYQMSMQLPEYEERLRHVNLDEVRDMDARSLVDLLIVQPLSSNFPAPEAARVILVDALDEATVNGKNDLARFIASGFEKAPGWLRLIVTSRPEPEVTSPLQAFTPFRIDGDSLNNERDICQFLSRELGDKASPAAIRGIMKKCDGLFIYAEWVVRELRYKRLSLDRPDDFPQGLGGIYITLFERQFPDKNEWASCIRPPLEVIAASQEPIDMDRLASIFRWNAHDERRFRRSLGSLFLADKHGIRPFHNSVMEWLANDEKDDPYFISPVEGHILLADHGLNEYQQGPLTWSPYDLLYLPYHLFMAKRLKELFGVLADFRFVRASGERDIYNLLKLWTTIERDSGLRMADIYRQLLDHPEKADNDDLLFLAGLFNNTYHYDEALGLYAYLSSVYRTSGEAARLQKILGEQARILYVRSDYDAAMGLLREQESICRETGNFGDLQSSLYKQASILTLKNFFDTSMALLKEQEAICRSIGDLDGLYKSLNVQAVILRVRGDYDRCMALLGEQENISRRLGNVNGLEESLGDQGVILTTKGDLDRAMALFKEQEQICRRIGNKDHLKFSLGGQALILRWRGDLDGAMALLKEDERLCREIGNKFGLAESIGDQAIVLRQAGDLDGAMALLAQRESLSRELGDKWGLQTSLRNKAILLRLRGDLDGAMELLRDVERICREIGHKRDLAVCLGNQGIVLAAKGDLDGALGLYGHVEGAFREMGYLYGLQECLGEKAMALSAKGDLEGALVALGEQRKYCKDMGLKPDLIRCLERMRKVLHALEDRKAPVKELELSSTNKRAT